MRAIRKLATICAVFLLVCAIPTRARDLDAQAPSRPGHPDGPGWFGPPPPPPPPPDPALGPVRPLLERLELDREQRGQVRDLVRDRMEGGLGERVRAFGDARHELEVRLWDPGATEGDILEASALVAERAGALELGRRELALEILAVLTEEQRAEFREMLARRPGPPPPGR